MSTEKQPDDGGPAFPVCVGNGNVVGGLSKREYFAAAALSGIIAKQNCFSIKSSIAEAFEYADAFLEARKQ